MAKVKKIAFRIAGKYMETHVKFSADGRHNGPPKGFSIEYPAYVALAMDEKFVVDKTLDGCIDLFKKKLEEFEGTKLERTKVIVFEFEASERPKPKERVAQEKRDRPEWRKEDAIETTLNDFTDGWRDKMVHRGLKLGWQLAERVEYGDRVEFQDEEKHKVNVRDDGEGRQWMKWTEAREAFFRQLDAALDALVVRAGAILDQPGDKFASLIDGGKGITLIGMDKKS